MECRDFLDQLVLQENRAQQDPQETKDPLAQLGCLELTDLVVILDLMDLLDLMAHQERKDS